MAHRICSAPDCETPVGPKGARGLCPEHYRILRAELAPPCSVEGCEKPAQTRGMCGAHAIRERTYGDPLAPKLRQANVGACSVEGCGQTSRKRGWCASHYAQQRLTGGPPMPFKYKWGEEGGACKVCGAPAGGKGVRGFCSKACWLLDYQHGGNRPKSVPCVACGTAIDLTARGKRGQLRKVAVKFCPPCRQDYNKYKMSARELALRDGTDCGLCGEPVDMELRRSESNMCASVDHILPRSLGGTHEPENLQLAHLYCNQVKSDGRGTISAP